MERELRLLDGDAGVRIEGVYEGKKCFAFVTRFGGTYPVMVFSAKGGRNNAPGRKLATAEFKDTADVMEFLRPVAVPKVDAYAY